MIDLGMHPTVFDITSVWSYDYILIVLLTPPPKEKKRKTEVSPVCSK